MGALVCWHPDLSGGDRVTLQTQQVCSVGRGGARVAQWFHEDLEPSQEASQAGFSFCHGVFLCASTNDCVLSSFVLTVFLLGQYLKQ